MTFNSEVRKFNFKCQLSKNCTVPFECSMFGADQQEKTTVFLFLPKETDSSVLFTT